MPVRERLSSRAFLFLLPHRPLLTLVGRACRCELKRAQTFNTPRRTARAHAARVRRPTVCILYWRLFDSTFNGVFVGDGDSIVFGQGTTTNYTNNLSLTRGPWKIYNLGISGETVQTMLARAPTAVDPLFQPGLRNVVAIEGGQNDFTAGRTPAQVFTDLQSYCTARRAVGWQCVVWTKLSSRDFDASGQNAALTALILGSPSSFDGTADYSGTQLGCNGCWSTSGLFQTDGTHPIALGITSIEAPVASTTVNALP